MLIFFGTSPRSARFLEQALKNGLKVDLVVSESPKPVGKKQVLTENPTVTTARKLNIPSVLNLSDLSNLSDLRVGLILDFNKIIPGNVINLFSKGIINIHFSKLPQYRGPAPVQYTILNGEKEAWITYSLIEEKLDAGKIIAQTSLPLDFTENTETLYQKLISKAASEIKEIIDKYLSDRDHPCQQKGTPSMTHKLTADNSRIDWTKPPEQIERLIRAAYPEPGAWTWIELQSTTAAKQQKKSNISEALKLCCSEANAKRLKILKAHLENNQLVLDLVQLEGKNPVTWKQFKEGHPDSNITI